MAHWVLRCPQCKMYFTHSQASAEQRYDLWVLPSKPEFPEGGSWHTCPNCKETALFQRFHLTYAAAQTS
jgi:hypothetical protein